METGDTCRIDLAQKLTIPNGWRDCFLCAAQDDQVFKNQLFFKQASVNDWKFEHRITVFKYGSGIVVLKFLF